jgi:hypothetical protein
MDLRHLVSAAVSRFSSGLQKWRMVKIWIPGVGPATVRCFEKHAAKVIHERSCRCKSLFLQRNAYPMFTGFPFSMEWCPFPGVILDIGWDRECISFTLLWDQIRLKNFSLSCIFSHKIIEVYGEVAPLLLVRLFSGQVEFFSTQIKIYLDWPETAECSEWQSLYVTYLSIHKAGLSGRLLTCRLASADSLLQI